MAQNNIYATKSLFDEYRMSINVIAPKNMVHSAGNGIYVYNPILDAYIKQGDEIIQNLAKVLEEKNKEIENLKGNINKPGTYKFADLDCTREQLEDLIGALTSSIRGSWNDPGERTDVIIEICDILEEHEWVKAVTEFYQLDDGRHFRDSPHGIPYGYNEGEIKNPLVAKFHKLICYDCREGKRWGSDRAGICNDPDRFNEYQ